MGVWAKKKLEGNGNLKDMNMKIGLRSSAMTRNI
jgi:hypothetical protein